MQYCSLSSGSSGNAHLIRTKRANILVDLGLSLRYIDNALFTLGLSPEDIGAVFITHDHADHVSGLGAFHRRTGCDIYLTEGTLDKITPKLGEVNWERVHILKAEQEISYNDIDLSAIKVSHDAVEPVCFSLSSHNKKISILTDLGKMEDHIIKKAQGSDLLVIEANHDKNMLLAGPYPYKLKQRVSSDFGHLSNEACAEAVLNIASVGLPPTVLLAHLSAENNLPELAYIEVKKTLEDNGAVIGSDLDLGICHRKTIGNLYRLGI